MKKYDCHVKYYSRETPSNVEFRHIKLIGYDFIVDSFDGTPYFLEGNATPYGIPFYEKLYDGKLATEIQRMFRTKGKIGINLDLETIKGLSSHKNRYANTKYIADLLKEASIDFVTFSDKDTELMNGKWLVKGQPFDIFWNRCFGIPGSYDRLNLDNAQADLLPTPKTIRLWLTNGKL
jgi:hypothetical protein